MSLLAGIPNSKRAAIKAANDPSGALMDIRICVRDIRRRIKDGEASDTDISSALLAIWIMSGGN